MLAFSSNLADVVSEGGFELDGGVTEEEITGQINLKEFLMTSKLFRNENIAAIPPQEVALVWNKAVCKIV